MFRLCIASVALLHLSFCFAGHVAASADIVFPQDHWAAKASGDLRLDAKKLDAVAAALGGRGCIIKNGYVVKSWGDQRLRGDWASSAKPVLSTLLMFALHEGKIKSFDQPVTDFGWELLPKDRTMTLRHLASMTSGYARPEKPGEAWAYNDYAIQLYQKTLFDKIFHGDPETTFLDPHRFGALQFEDGFEFRKSNRRISASVRDFARVVWFWLNRGNWNGAQLLPRQYFDDNMRPQVPPDLPLSSDAKTNDYLHIGTYGGESNHFSKAGPGMYGFNWWFNGMGGNSPTVRNWPDAPADAFMSIGARGNSSALMPKLNLVVVAADADWGELEPGNPEAKINQRLKLIAEAGTPLPSNGSQAPRVHTISIAGFRDGAHHWRTIRDETRFIQALPDQATYAPDQVEEIVANILLFQRANGGWPKDYDYLAVLTPEQVAAVRATHDRADTSFDNHNTHSHVDYLARAYAAYGNDSWRAACLRGFDFMLAAQLTNGGFPQRYPGAKGYSAHITFNDGVMIGILNVLKDAADGAPHWQWLDAERRDLARQAVGRAVDCILNCQIKTPAGRTGWCQQHDENTFEAASARTFELASCCPQDTTEIVRFLMRLDSPDERVVKAVDDAIVWLRKTQLSGIRVQHVPAKSETFERHTADFDTVVVADPSAPPLWARHYEIGTDRPIFASRDGIKRYTFAEIDRERRTGTLWYGNWPLQLIKTEYPRWRKKHSEANRARPK